MESSSGSTTVSSDDTLDEGVDIDDGEGDLFEVLEHGPIVSYDNEAGLLVTSGSRRDLLPRACATAT